MGSRSPNEAAVQAYLMPKLEIIVNTVLDHIKEENSKAIKEFVYNKYTPVVDGYKRTHQFKEAWGTTEAKTQGNVASGQFQYEPDKMKYNPKEGQHGTPEKYAPFVSRGGASMEYLANIIYEGVSSGLFVGDWSDKRDAFSELVKIVGSSKMKSWVQEGANKAGLAIHWHRLPTVKKTYLGKGTH